MIVTCLDVETTFKVNPDGTTDPSPFAGNHLVSVGYKMIHTKNEFMEEDYLCFTHNEEPPTKNNFTDLQAILDDTEIMVGHNIKFDLMWLRECGFVYDGLVFDTMIAEYILARGRKKPFKLVNCLERRGLSPKKVDLTEPYLKDKIGFEAMPWVIVEEYGRGDVTSTLELAEAQLVDLDAEWKDLTQ